MDFAVEGKKLSFIDLLLLQACGDIYELKEAYKPKAQRVSMISKVDPMGESARRRARMGSGAADQLFFIGRDGWRLG